MRPAPRLSPVLPFKPRGSGWKDVALLAAFVVGLASCVWFTWRAQRMFARQVVVETVKAECLR